MTRTLEEKQELVKQFDELKEEGLTNLQASKKLNLTSASDIYRFRKQAQKADGKSPVREIKRVNLRSEKMLLAENTRLRTLVVDLSLDVQALKEYHSR